MKRYMMILLVGMLAAISVSCEKMTEEEFVKKHILAKDENDPDNNDNPDNDDTPGNDDTEPVIPTEDGIVIESGVVDLGLSVKWAACNLDAETESGFAEYCVYQGTRFSWANTSLVMPPAEIGGTQYDYAKQILGEGWMTPSKAQFDELKEKCRIHYSTYRGIDGAIITGSTGNAIFIPENNHEYYISGDYRDKGYWTSSYDLSSGLGICVEYYRKQSSGYYFTFDTQSINYANLIRPVYTRR